MRGALLLGLVGVGFAGLVTAGGCGGGGSATTGGSGGSGGATASSSSAHSSSTGVTTGTGGMGGGGDGHDFATAEPIDINSSLMGDLSPTGVANYYTFEGQAGQALDIFTQAQTTLITSYFDPHWIDTVITLYGPDQKQIAENNDVVPRRNNDSEIITILPATGTYWVRVEECWTWASDPKTTCAGVADKDATTYLLGIAELDPSKPSEVMDAETGDDAAHATPLTFSKASNGSYYLTTVWGTFKDGSDVDVFSFTIPSDAVTPVAGKRGIVNFWAPTAGKFGNGSTSPAGKIYLVDPADPAKHYAELYGPDFTYAPRLWPALDLTKPWLLFVEHPATAGGANDFYVLLQGQGTSNPVEVNEAANDTIAGAETPADSPDASGHHYYVDGDLINDAADVDHWKVPVGTSTEVAVSCAAQRGGSGLRGFKIDVIDPATMMVAATVQEASSSDAYTGYQPIPTGATDLVVKLSATSQDPNITSAFYHCGIHTR